MYFKTHHPVHVSVNRSLTDNRLSQDIESIHLLLVNITVTLLSVYLSIVYKNDMLINWLLMI